MPRKVVHDSRRPLDRVLALLLSYCALAQVVKRWYVNHSGAWL
jgi:hypothetical protein